jgi:hypothetical protein
LVEANLAEHSYFIAIPAYDGKVCAETCSSLLGVSGFLGFNGINHQMKIIRSGALIDSVRNDLFHSFLHDSSADTLILLDSDIMFEWEDFQRLVVFSHHHDIVCGSYPSKKDTPEFIVNYNKLELDKDGLLPITSIGMGFVAIKRQALLKMQDVLETYFDNKTQRRIYAYCRLEIKDGEYIGEDIHFFNKAVEAGIQPMLDPAIVLGHVGIKQYTEKFKDHITPLLAVQSA